MFGKRFVAGAAVVALAVGAAAAAYVVERGDTLWAIAQANGTTVAEIAELNGISNPNLIQVGQKLKLPGSLSEPAKPEPEQDETDDAPSKTTEGKTHRVARGDTLYSIARANGTTVAALAQINSIANPNLIRVGQVITVSGERSNAAPPAPTSPSPAAPSQSQIGDLLDQTARQHGLDPAIVKAVAWRESRWRVDAVSSAGARGIMQVMPSTGRWISTNLAGRTLNLDDPADNILAGVLYLKYLDGFTGGNEARTLASYLQGPNAVARNGISAAGSRYVADVRALAERFR